MNKLLKSLILSIFIILPGVLSVQAYSHKKGGTLIMSVGATPRHLNPAVQSGIDTGAPGAQLFATPLRFDENWNPQPYLAESWSISDDGLSVTLNLVKGATFHDGKPITSKRCCFFHKNDKSTSSF